MDKILGCVIISTKHFGVPSNTGGICYALRIGYHCRLVVVRGIGCDNYIIIIFDIRLELELVQSS